MPIHFTQRPPFGGLCVVIQILYEFWTYLEILTPFKNAIRKINIDLLLKIAGVGILIAVLHQILTKAGRDDQAMMTSLAGMVIVLTIVVKEISTLFATVRTVFNL